MGRESTLPDKWLELAKVCGGVGQLAEALGVSIPTLFRVARGMSPARPEFRMRLAVLAADKRVKSPLPPFKPPKKLDELEMRVLEELGKAIAVKTPVPQSFVDRIVGRFGEEALIGVAESDDVKPAVHLAVMKLLGGL